MINRENHFPRECCRGVQYATRRVPPSPGGINDCEVEVKQATRDGGGAAKRILTVPLLLDIGLGKV